MLEPDARCSAIEPRKIMLGRLHVVVVVARSVGEGAPVISSGGPWLTSLANGSCVAPSV